VIHIVIHVPDQAREPGGNVPLAEPFYRACNYANGGRDHFFTVNKAEWENASSRFGYSSEGTACRLWTTQIPGTVPLYRLWSGADHFYTQHEQEQKGLRHPWIYEGIAGYVLSNRIEGTVPFYRMFCRGNGDHHYTVSEAERHRCISVGGWVDEGYVGYVVPP